jgi:hypothetical protein
LWRCRVFQRLVVLIEGVAGLQKRKDVSRLSAGMDKRPGSTFGLIQMGVRLLPELSEGKQVSFALTEEQIEGVK